MSEVEEDDWSRSCTPESLASAGVPPQELYSDEEEDLDEMLEQTIAVDLETLTDTGSSVNKLEIALLEARKEYEYVKRSSQLRLTQVRSRLNSFIEKTEPYVVAWRKARELQEHAHIAAYSYERAHSEFESAKETLKIAERSIAEIKEEQEESGCGHNSSSAIAIDEAWQETLANATLRVEKANQDKIETGIEHHRLTVEYQKIQSDCHNLEMKLKRSIRKSKPYYEERHACNQTLLSIKRRIQVLQEEIDEQKFVYKRTMRHLESLSGLMHEERVRRRTNSALDITSSEPNLIGQRTLTPDFPLEVNHTHNRMSLTPDYRRKKDWSTTTNIRAVVPFAPAVPQPLPLISTTQAAAVIPSNNGETKETATHCLTRVLATSGVDNHRIIPMATNCTITISVSHDVLPLSPPPPPPDHNTESAKQLVAVTLLRALEHYQNELSNSNHGDGNRGNISNHGNDDTLN